MSTYRFYFIILVGILIIRNYSFSQTADTVKNPADNFVKSFEYDSLSQNYSQHNICKITADFNCDGIKDVAVSDSYLCGWDACYWEIYLGLGDDYFSYFSTLWFNNYAIEIDSVSRGRTNIYIYDKTGAGTGNVIEYNLSSDEGIIEIGHKTIYPDTFPENEDYKYYKSIFTQPPLIESCINVSEYLKTKKLDWK